MKKASMPQDSFKYPVGSVLASHNPFKGTVSLYTVVSTYHDNTGVGYYDILADEIRVNRITKNYIEKNLSLAFPTDEETPNTRLL